MPFPSINLTPAITAQINAFMADVNLPDLYMAYDWQNDKYTAGFPDILDLESQLSANDINAGLTLQDVINVAAWGRLRNPGRIHGPQFILRANTFFTAGGNPQPNLADMPMGPIHALNINGLGPTYKSKILRFALPQEYGAIDTRCVRVFGQGDPANQQHNWIPISARNGGYGWYISEAQTNWPNGYDVWVNILRHIANGSPNNCPHPPDFIATGMRPNNNMWFCADVEMALFTYASQFV